MSGKHICLRQHLGDEVGPMTKKFIELSQSDLEVNHYLRCGDGEVEVFGDVAPNCSVIIRLSTIFVP